jgi:hypothetical protein
MISVNQSVSDELFENYSRNFFALLRAGFVLPFGPNNDGAACVLRTHHLLAGILIFIAGPLGSSSEALALSRS